jgi:hypothetical protein
VIEITVGALLGIVSGLFGAVILFRTVKLLGPGEEPARGTALVFVGFLFKWPFIIGLGYVAWQRSATALYAFTTAVIVVYFALVWRALRGGLF